MKYLLDSNIFIYAAAGLEEALTVLDKADFGEMSGFSAMTRLEVLGYRKFSEDEEVKLLEILSCFYEYDVSKTIIDKAIMLRKSINIKTPDAIIAATALEIGAVLVTRNEKDFKNIDGLTVVNPWG